MKLSLSLLILVVALAGCATSAAPSPQDVFFARLSALCGQSFAGRVTTTDAADAAMRGQPLRMDVRDCTPTQVRMPFSVGADRSRTWIVTRTASGLRLKHDHRHADGTPDRRTDYGGDTAEAGTATRQSFPVDAESIALFLADGAPQSVTNVWSMEVEPQRLFAYELRREGRWFRAEFDLSRPLADD